MFNDNTIDETLQRLLKICERRFVDYGKDFPYATLSELSRTLYDVSGGLRQDFLMDSLRYQRELLPKQFNDLTGCISCAQKQLNKKRRIEKAQIPNAKSCGAKKGSPISLKILKEPDNLTVRRHPSNEHPKE